MPYPVMTVAELQAHLDRLDDGILRHGAHSPGREFCALEFKSQVDGIDWTDNPNETGLPDLRPLNDAAWSSDIVRTRALLPVMVALWDWRTWSSVRQQKWLEQIIIETTKQLIAPLPFFKTRGLLQNIQTIEDVREQSKRAARAAWAAGATRAVEAVEAVEATGATGAAWAARAAGATGATGAAESDRVLNLACAIWIQAVTDTTGL